MTSLEGPAVGWLLTKLGPVGRWVHQQVRPNHRPIAERRCSPVHTYHTFCLFVAVAPSDLPPPRAPVDFIGAAHKFVRGGLSDLFTQGADYSGPELVRYRQSVPHMPSASSIVEVYPTGLVELLWTVAVPPATSLPLCEITELIRRLHQLVQKDEYPGLHRGRRFERWRRVDWRIGVNAAAVAHDNSGSVSWTSVTAPVTLPTDRMRNPRPSCPRNGYAAGPLTSVRRTIRLERLLQPVLEELLSAAGYTDTAEIRRCATEAANLAVTPEMT